MVFHCSCAYIIINNAAFLVRVARVQCVNTIVADRGGTRGHENCSSHITRVVQHYKWHAPLLRRFVSGKMLFDWIITVQLI